MSKASSYDKTAVESTAGQSGQEAAAKSEGKRYAYQPPTEAATVPSKVLDQKEKIVSAFGDFMDTLAEHIVSGKDPDPGTTYPAAPVPVSGVPAGQPGTLAVGAVTAPAATTAAASPSSGGAGKPTSGTAPAAGHGETPAMTEAAKKVREQEAFEAAIVSHRSAYLTDTVKETTRKKRQWEAKNRGSQAGGPSTRGDEIKHASDSNRAPITESAHWESSFGSLGKSSAPTIEKLAVPAKRPETVPAPATISGAKPIDAWFGSFGNAIERAKHRAETYQNARLESIIGADDRIRVTNVRNYPWRCICSLLITANTGAQYVGTGWLVAPRLVLTAGHCVYMADEGGWVTRIEVIPGRNAEERPFGSAIALEFRSVTGWTQDNDSDFDYGGILLPADKRFGDQLGWFGYANRNDDYLENLTLNLSGYPGDGGKAPNQVDGSQWFHNRTIREAFEKQITYEIDTFGGQSGAPVWEVATDGSRYGVAIHTFGTSVNNGGTRITGEVFNNIVFWAGQVP